ncbi:hypothetical protein E2C01_000975 [Portunus trituberculatus]|uniref:Uncharacterized protein n=1 Tax=Portunus trituberculatus TaxID=210409 RepID=A0A5B7CGG2_PORTR|nr:hypothetical protein [Portunus trituberculatus]
MALLFTVPTSGKLPSATCWLLNHSTALSTTSASTSMCRPASASDLATNAVSLEYSVTTMLGTNLAMFCSPHPVGSSTRLCRSLTAGPSTSPEPEC